MRHACKSVNEHPSLTVSRYQREIEWPDIMRTGRHLIAVHYGMRSVCESGRPDIDPRRGLRTIANLFSQLKYTGSEWHIFLVHSTHCLCLSKLSIHALPRRPSSLSFWVSNHAFWGLLLKLQTVLELIELNRWMSNCMTPAVLFFSSCWNGFDLCDQTRGFDPFVQSQVTKNFNQDCGIQACGRWGWTRPHLRVRLGTSQWRDSWKPDFMILFLEKTKCKGQLEVVVLRNKQDQANVKLFRRTLRWI